MQHRAQRGLVAAGQASEREGVGPFVGGFFAVEAVGEGAVAWVG